MNVPGPAADEDRSPDQELSPAEPPAAETAVETNAPEVELPNSVLAHVLDAGAGAADRLEDPGDQVLQRSPTGGAPAEAPPIVHDVLSSAGAPLDSATREEMEGQLGADLSDVRVHTDDQAAASARAVNARAYTVGSSIVFDSEGYAPQQPDGRRLLAHELVHTIQQGGGQQPSSGGPLPIGSPDSAAESEAHGVAEAASADRLAEMPSITPHQAPGRTLARAPAPAPVAEPKAPARSFELGGLTITTYGEAAVAMRFWCSQLDDEKATLTKGSVAVPRELEATHKRGLEVAKVLGDKPEPLDVDLREDLRAWHTAYIKAMNAGRAAQAYEAAARATASAAEQQALYDKLSELEPALREAQRAAFRNNDENALLQIADAFATILDTGLVVKDAIEKTIDTAAELRALAGTRGSETVIQLGNGTKEVLDTLQKIGKVYAAFQVVRAAIDVGGGSKTQMAKSIKGVAGMATVVGAGGTLLNASVGFTLYSNLYIGPMTSACVTLLTKIKDNESKGANRDWISAGRPENVDWMLEPGGRPMFDFMLKVMRATSPAEVPQPIGEINNYLVAEKDDFSAGVGSKGGDLPTEGWWLWEDTDTSKIKDWIYKNRQHLWGMLYGPTPVPSVEPLL